MSGLLSFGPASSNATRFEGSAVSRLANTQPADPAPVYERVGSARWQQIPFTFNFGKAGLSGISLSLSVAISPPPDVFKSPLANISGG